MTTPQTTATTDLQGIIAVLQQRLDAALAREATLAEELAARAAEMATRIAELAERKTEFDERIEYQAATVDVLRVMSASPGDPQPVFDLIVHRSNELCNGAGVALFEFDGRLVHYRTDTGVPLNSEGRTKYLAMFPMVPIRGSITCRAILEKRVIHVPNFRADPELLPIIKALGWTAQLSVPLMREGSAIGVITLVNRTGAFSDSQIELLKTFAEQAVIAITSAETFRALQTRTADLQETLEYQTAISDVLKVISRSTFDLQPVLDTLVETAARLCDADQALISRREGEVMHFAANYGFPPEYETYLKARGPVKLDPGSLTVAHRTLIEGRPVHIDDVTAVPGYPEVFIRLGKHRTSLGVPLLRGGDTIGFIQLSRQQVEPFTDRQIALVSTFADQAVIAIENTRLITEQREALEQQTATAEVLQVINASPGNLAPVFDAMLEKAMRLCGGTMGGIFTFDGDHSVTSAVRGVTAAFQEYNDKYPMDKIQPGTVPARIIETRGPVQNPDLTAGENYHAGHPYARALVELGGIRAVLAVPLLKDGVAIGMVAIYRQEAGAFSDKQIALLQNFAAQAVIAMENARLLTEQQEALEQQTATAEVLQVINANPGNLTPVFDAILDKAHTLCGAAIGSLVLFDGTYFRAVATHGWPNSITALFSEPAGPNRARQRLVDGEVFVQVADIRAIGRGPNSAWGDAVVESTDARTMLLVPLRKDGALLGFISAFRPEVRVFSDKEIALLENFAAQAVIAMENARLLTETREALEQQTATAEVLQVINASPGDLTPVFDAMLEKAMRLCGAAFGSLYTYDGERFLSAAQRGVPPAYAAFRAGHPPTPAQGTGIATLVETRKPVHAIDVAASELYRAGHPGVRAVVELGGARTSLVVPLLKDDALLGFISVYRQEVRAFSDKQIALLENFAAQAVIAIENARLLTEQREALEQQTATAEVLQVINANPGNLTPVFDAILENAHRLCGARVGALGTYDGTNFRALATHGYPERAEAAIRQAYPRGPNHEPLFRGEPLHVREVKTHPWTPELESMRSYLEKAGLNTMLSVPLHKDGVLLGFISAASYEVRPFSEKEITLLENFAAQAVIAMENARLLDEIRQRQDELRITFENMGDGVAMFDETQHLVAWNRKFQDILDVPDEALAARRTFVEYIRYLTERGEFGQGAEQEEQVRRIQTTRGRATVFERTRPNGRVIEVRQNPVPGGGFVLIYADITERKRNEAEIRAARDAAEEASRTIEGAYRELKTAQANLIQAEKMASLGQLTAGIAHEIKNPLNFVNNFAALSVDLLGELKETAAPGFAALTDKQRAEVEEVSAMLTSNLEKITEHGKRADGIVKAMLEHSRGSSGERRMVDLNTLIDDALNLAYHGARAQDQGFNITLERDFSAGIAPIEVNPQDMTRVFLNIFSNGFYATTRRGRDGGDAGFVPTLKVTTIDAGEAVEIRVRDNGTGIPADIRDKLFQPFFTTKPTGEGTGLGLSITYDIVTQQHGGSIAVASIVGEYSEFTIRLPPIRKRL